MVRMLAKIFGVFKFIIQYLATIPMIYMYIACLLYFLHVRMATFLMI